MNLWHPEDDHDCTWSDCWICDSEEAREMKYLKRMDEIQAAINVKNWAAAARLCQLADTFELDPRAADALDGALVFLDLELHPSAFNADKPQMYVVRRLGSVISDSREVA